MEQKIFANRATNLTKKFYKRNKKCSRRKILFRVTWSLLNMFLVAFHVHVWPFATLQGLVSVVWHYHGLVWPLMAVLWSFRAKYWFDWTFNVFFRGRKSKFIFSIAELNCCYFCCLRFLSRTKTVWLEQWWKRFLLPMKIIWLWRWEK